MRILYLEETTVVAFISWLAVDRKSGTYYSRFLCLTWLGVMIISAAFSIHNEPGIADLLCGRPGRGFQLSGGRILSGFGVEVTKIWYLYRKQPLLRGPGNHMMKHLLLV
jgi:hypothetical protein